MNLTLYGLRKPRDSPKSSVISMKLKTSRSKGKICLWPTKKNRRGPSWGKESKNTPDSFANEAGRIAGLPRLVQLTWNGPSQRKNSEGES